MALITIERETNLNKVPISVDVLHGMMFSKEAGAHKFLVTCTKDGEQVQLTGTVTAYVLLTNGHTQRLESGGTTPYTGIENGKAWATLHQACYAVPGRFQISIFVTDTNGVTTCVYAAVGVIQRSATDNEYDPGDAVPTINDLEAWIAACQQATEDAIAAAQGVDDIVLVQSAQPTSESNKIWIQPQADEYQVPTLEEHEELAGEVEDLKSAIDTTKTNFIGESNQQSRQRSITGLVANPTNGFYKVSNGQFAESDSYRTYEFNLPDGTNHYNLSIYQRGNGSSDGTYYVYMAYDENNNLIDYRTQTVATQQLSITVPDNAVKIIYTKENVASNSCMMTWKTSAFDHINALERNIAVFIGDSYVGGNSLGEDVDKRFSTILSGRMGWIEKNFAVGGMGYIYGNTTFEDQIDNAVADTTYNHDDVKYVLICGGRNDGGTYPYMDATLTAAVQSTITAARTGFPNAIVIVVPMLWDYQYISRAIYPLYQTIIYAAQTLDAVIIPNAYTWLIGMKGMILPDGVHPNVSGHAIIASHIENALTTGNSFAFPSSRVLNPVSESIDGSATNYFTITQENGLIHFDSEFKLSAGVSAKTTLFSLTVANNENVPAYTGNYERFLVAQKSDGALATLSVTTTIADGGYTIIAKAVTALSAGTYYMDGEFIPFALQRFASWRS